MKKLAFASMLALLVVSQHSLASEVAGGGLYKACLAVETKHAAADGQGDPKLAAHYLCTIIANDCVKRPDGQRCGNAKRQYGVDRQ